MINKAVKDQQSRDANIHKLTSLSRDNSPLSIRIQTAVHNPDLKPPALEHYNDVDGAIKWDKDGLYHSIVMDPPLTKNDLYLRAQKHVKWEEDENNRKKRDYVAKDISGSRNNKHPDNNKIGNGGDKTQQNRDFKPFVMELTPLNTAYAVIYEHIKDKGLITPPPPLKESTKTTRDKSKRCKVHDDYGHDTEDCHYLRRNIERLVQRGLLDKYLLNKTPKSTLAITIHNVINACFARVSTLSRRQVKNAHRDKTKYLREYYYVNQLNFLKDLIGVFCPHNDALVITAWVAMWRVQRIMVDAGSSASILFSNCYSQMQLAGDLIIPEDNPVVGFDGTAAKAVGRISLTINVGHK
ncbi:hypothetical protein FRX31_025179, partial [Thalictrum thalictroides]